MPESAKAKRERKLERFRKQHQPQSYPRMDTAHLKPEKPFVPTRQQMYNRIKEETLKNETVRADLKNLSRKERRKRLAAIVHGAVADIREQMIKEMEVYNQTHGE